MHNRCNNWLAIGMACLLQACAPTPAEPQPPEDTALQH